jgi:hypothetical protein
VCVPGVVCLSSASARPSEGAYDTNLARLMMGGFA